MVKQSIASAVATYETQEQPLFAETYTLRDYEVILDVLYGLFTPEEATKVRIYDPFVTETKHAPLVTPRMLTDRLEAYLSETAMPKAS